MKNRRREIEIRRALKRKSALPDIALVLGRIIRDRRTLLYMQIGEVRRRISHRFMETAQKTERGALRQN